MGVVIKQWQCRLVKHTIFRPGEDNWELRVKGYSCYILGVTLQCLHTGLVLYTNKENDKILHKYCTISLEAQQLNRDFN